MSNLTNNFNKFFTVFGIEFVLLIVVCLLCLCVLLLIVIIQGLIISILYSTQSFCHNLLAFIGY